MWTSSDDLRDNLFSKSNARKNPTSDLALEFIDALLGKVDDTMAMIEMHDSCD
jgi:hypothetical protein